MSRLVTFGCSFVYGHGLPDCHIEPARPGSHPSKFAWPQLLADKLGYECHNLSKPASGNFEILLKVLNTEFLPDDLVIIAWSFFQRYDFYKMTDYKGNGIDILELHREKYAEKSNELLAANLKSNDKYFEQLYWDNWLVIQHAELLLNKKKIKNFSYIGMTSYVEPRPKTIELDNFLNINLIMEDKGLDNMHPGLESHKLQAELIYSKIIDRIK